MTWTKLGQEFSDECANAGIPDAAFRTHVEAIAWLYRVERMDCLIPKGLVRRFAGSEQYEEGVQALLGIEWWKDASGHYEITHHADIIRASITAQQKQRVTAKEASRRYRRKLQQAAPDKGTVMDDVMDDVTHDAVSQSDRHLQEAVVDARTAQLPQREPEPSQPQGACPKCQVSVGKDGWCSWCQASVVA